VLESERLRLRLWRDEEVPRISEARTNEATAHFLPFIPQPFTADDAHRLLASTRQQAAEGRRHWLRRRLRRAATEDPDRRDEQGRTPSPLGDGTLDDKVVYDLLATDQTFTSRQR
jgi:RimJ/RimL family protein N-acetyltransferase